MLKIAISDMSLKIANLRLQPHLPGANTLSMIRQEPGHSVIKHDDKYMSIQLSDQHPLVNQILTVK